MSTNLTTRSGRPVSRLGLGGSPGMEPDAVRAAWDGGVTWFFLYNLSFDGTIEGLRALAARERDDLVIAAGTEDRDPDAAADALDVLMHRYNMAHRGAEEAVLPAARQAGVPVCAFTCTRWGSLLEGHGGWAGDVPSAADCYRFALAQPAVRLALTAPKTATQMRANLAALTPERMDEAQMERWRRYGALVYGDGKGAFETDWP